MAENRDSDDVISSYPFSESDSSESDEPFVCPDCDEEFSTKRGLNIHRGQQHDTDET